MIRGQSFVVLSITPWETPLPSSGHFLFDRFAQENRVLFVDHPLTWKDLFLRENRHRLRRTLEGLCALGDPSRDLWLLSPPPLLPINGLPEGQEYDWLLERNARVVAASVKRAMNRLGMKKPIFWNSFDVPLGYALLGKLEEGLRVYHCFDEIRGEAYISRHGSRLETALIRRSDLVITSSEGLVRPGAHFVPNGVDHEHFARALGPIPIPPELAALPRPLIGYWGHAESRLDYDLLERLLNRRPHYTLVLVGPIHPSFRERVKRLNEYPNFFALGARPHREAPHYLKGFDVGIIPFVQSLQTRGVYPLKLNEYLAAGLPVVMTPFAPLEEFREIAHLAEGDAFLEAIDRALLEGDRKDLRSAFALQNSWEDRVEKISRLLERTLKGE